MMTTAEKLVYEAVLAALPANGTPVLYVNLLDAMSTCSALYGLGARARERAIGEALRQLRAGGVAASEVETGWRRVRAVPLVAAAGEVAPRLQTPTAVAPEGALLPGTPAEVAEAAVEATDVETILDDTSGWLEGVLTTDRAAWAAWCTAKTGEAEREAAAYEAREEGGFGTITARIMRCEGQASAFKAMAALLTGGRS